VQVLPPVNFTLTVCALAQVLLHWEPNPAQEQSNSTIRYEVKILSPVLEEYDTRRTHSVRTAALHDGFAARVRTQLWQEQLQLSSDWVEGHLPPLPGAAGTSVTNLSCVTRVTIPGNVSLHCTWLPGQGAPADTKYFLFYRLVLAPLPASSAILSEHPGSAAFQFRYEAHTEECPTYTRDKWNRNTECRFSSTQIKPGEIDNLIVIHINGSSKRAAIKPFQQLFNQNAIEKVNIPRNISISLEQNDLLAMWEKPISPFHEECFEYEFYLINLKSGTRQLLKIPSNSFRVRLDASSRYSIRIRANHNHICRAAGLWSHWSETFSVGQNKLENSIAWILTLLCVSTSCTFLLVAIICK
ncbi:IL5RA protein, partial [Cettia cetti]|nr:IL5RA protein [Cettia cetti]